MAGTGGFVPALHVLLEKLWDCSLGEKGKGTAERPEKDSSPDPSSRGYAPSGVVHFSKKWKAVQWRRQCLVKSHVGSGPWVTVSPRPG